MRYERGADEARNPEVKPSELSSRMAFTLLYPHVKKDTILCLLLTVWGYDLNIRLLPDHAACGMQHLHCRPGRCWANCQSRSHGKIHCSCQIAYWCGIIPLAFPSCERQIQVLANGRDFWLSSEKLSYEHELVRGSERVKQLATVCRVVVDTESRIVWQRCRSYEASK